MKTVDCNSRVRCRIAVAAAALLLPLAAHAATIPVGCAADQLRAAIATANSTAGPDILQLAPACTYAFTTVDNVWYGANALPPIASDITIEGNGATLFVPDVDTANAPIVRLRFFYVSGGLTPPRGTAGVVGAGKLTLRKLTLSSGRARGGNSGFGGGGAGMGGAIFNQGNLILDADTFVGNAAIGGSAQSAAGQFGGGGIGADAIGTTGGGFGASFGTYGGIGGSGDAISSGGGGGFSADGGTGFGTNWGGGTSDWGGSGINAAVASGEGGGGAGGAAGGNGGDFGMGGAYALSAGGGGGVGAGGGGGDPLTNSDGGGGGFGGGGGGGLNPGTGGFGGGGGGGGQSALGGYGGGGAGGGAGMGGAIFNHNGTLSIDNCTFAYNDAIGGSSTGGSSGDGLGGAIFNLQGSVRIRDSTLASNIGAGTNSAGGAVYNVGYLAGDDGGKLSSSSTIALGNSILADSSNGVTPISDLASDAPANLAGGFANIAVATVTFDSSDIVTNTANIGNSNVLGTPITNDPLLGPLQDNGGPTQTMALMAGSPAIDNGNSASAPATDQRGCPRVGTAPDIGAYEFFDSSQIVFRDGFDGVGSCR